MQTRLTIIVLTAILLAGCTAPRQASWTADNGNGTYSNPLFYEEFSDPSMIRVGPDYYFTGTTMHCMPGLPVLHSTDLVNWTLISYAFDRLDLAPSFRLQDGEIYGQGIWAPSFRHNDGTFYIFSNINRHGTQVYRATNPAGPWTHNRLKTTLYDLSVLFDDDGRIYAVHGVDEIKLTQLNPEITDVIPNTERIIIPRGSGMGEGLHFYKINGLYYIITAIPGGHTPMKCARSKTLNGPYEIKTISEKESMGIGLSYRLRERDGKFEILPPDINREGGLTLHQGGIVDTPTGQWWGYSMMDHNSIGRLTCLSPVTWKDGWPFFGLPGNLSRSPRVWVKPDTGSTEKPKPLFERSDDFSGSKLKPIWQWSHVPDDTKWSLQQRPGFLRLHSLPAPDFWWARNTLTQRSVGPESTVTAKLDTSGMQPGDVAGLALLNRPYAWLGVARTDTGFEIHHSDQFTGKTLTKAVNSKHLWFRAHCNFDIDIADFSYSTNGRDFKPIGEDFKLVFQLKTFQGIRYSLFHYNTSGSPGGVADFDTFTVDEPRPRGLIKPIPYGKSIVLTSMGDGKNLSIKDGKVCASDTKTRFHIVDRGPGRVALRTTDGFISVSDTGEAIIKKVSPDLAETFQWVDMQRGDIMLLSLVTNRYLQIKPNSAEPASANLPGPRPDRLDGSCFKWKL